MNLHGRDIKLFTANSNPKLAQDNGVQGTVVIEFIVDERGKVDRIKVLQSPDQLLTDATIKALEGVNSLTSGWRAGKVRGKVVKTKFTLPVSFKLTR